MNVLHVLLKLLDNSKKRIRNEAARAVSNIACGTRDQIQAVIDAGLVPKLIELHQTADDIIQKEAAWAVAGLWPTQLMDETQMKSCTWFSRAPFLPMCKLLGSTDNMVVEVVKFRSLAVQRLKAECVSSS